MRYLAFALVLVGVVTAARAQDAIPDLKGTWSGKGKSIVSSATTLIIQARKPLLVRRASVTSSSPL